MHSRLDRYNSILNNISKYLDKFKSINESVLEAEYFRDIEQDTEKLLDLINDGIIDIEIYEKVREIFIKLINLTKENGKEKKVINVILVDIYYIFKYVYESILFLIENEYL
jgi:hypothetical protein